MGSESEQQQNKPQKNYFKILLLVLLVIAVIAILCVVLEQAIYLVASLGFVFCWIIFGSGRK